MLRLRPALEKFGELFQTPRNYVHGASGGTTITGRILEGVFWTAMGTLGTEGVVSRPPRFAQQQAKTLSSVTGANRFLNQYFSTGAQIA